jgi:hypothetical protein
MHSQQHLLPRLIISSSSSKGQVTCNRQHLDHLPPSEVTASHSSSTHQGSKHMPGKG